MNHVFFCTEENMIYSLLSTKGGDGMKEINRKKGESFEGFLRRFNKIMLQSGRLIQARKNRYVPSKVNRNKRRGLALRRKKIESKMAYMEKTGKSSDR